MAEPIACVGVVSREDFEAVDVAELGVFAVDQGGDDALPVLGLLQAENELPGVLGLEADELLGLQAAPGENLLKGVCGKPWVKGGLEDQGESGGVKGVPALKGELAAVKGVEGLEGQLAVASAKGVEGLESELGVVKPRRWRFAALVSASSSCEKHCTRSSSSASSSAPTVSALRVLASSDTNACTSRLRTRIFSWVALEMAVSMPK